MDAPKYPGSFGTERELLESHIEFCREFVIYKVTGISKVAGVKRLGPTATSVLGILRHLTEVEHPDGEFKILETDTVESLLEGYKQACENSRQICSGRSLDDLAAHARPSDNLQPNLRWVYLHMIDETARHSGNIEIYRELIDQVHDGRTTS